MPFRTPCTDDVVSEVWISVPGTSDTGIVLTLVLDGECPGLRGAVLVDGQPGGGR